MSRTTNSLWSELPIGTFDVIVADPPWQYYGSKTKWAAAEKFYRTYDVETLATLPVAEMMHSKSVLFLWTTSTQLENSLLLLRQWNLHYRGMGFVWVKARKDGAIMRARGVRPSITKPTTEFVLCASKCRLGRPLPVLNEAVMQVVLQPPGSHSQKPEEVQTSIETLYGADMSKLELFARRNREGWICWGNELS